METNTVTFKQWYIVHTYSGFEERVKENLQQRIDALGMREKFGEIKIPTETLVEMKSGKKREVQRKFFPGYILVEMEMSDDAWHLVKNTPKVTGFVGTGFDPANVNFIRLWSQEGTVIGSTEFAIVSIEAVNGTEAGAIICHLN